MGLGQRHALHAVATRFEAQLPVDTVPGDAQHHFLVAPQFARRFAHDLGLPALGVGVARIQARQIAREQGRLVATGARADFDKGVAFVVRVLGHQQQL
ncbi:hypothetical protein FQZ97_1062600 [compost metagenome]